MRCSSRVLACLLTVACGPANGEAQAPEKWKHLSSAAGDLPAPPHSWRDQTACLVLDVDRDGTDDFVLTERNEAPAVVWYRHTPSGWERYVLEAEHVEIGAGGDVADIDGDGDIDVSFGGRGDSNQMWWWENPDPDFDPNRPWVRRTIKKSGERGHHDQIFGDFDGDGALELVAWNQGAKRLILAQLPDGPVRDVEWEFTTIFTYQGRSHEGLAKADINLDGRVDVVGAGYWFEHKRGTEFEPHLIDRRMPFTRAAAGQLVKGGRPEIVFVPGDAAGPLRWYEWDGNRWSAHELLEAEVEHGHSLDVGDINNDGNLDLFCAEMGIWSGFEVGNADAKAWIFYGDGRGGFTTEVVSSGIANHESKLGDLNGDGFLDIVTKPFRWKTPRVDVWIQQGHAADRPFSLNRWERKVIGVKDHRSTFIQSADIDGDGHLDLVTGGWWFRNPGAGGNAWPRRDIGSPLLNMAAVYDFDNDGDPDVLGTKGRGSQRNSEFVWARNDGTATFKILENIESGEGGFLQGASVAQFNVGGPLQVALSWHMPKGTRIQTLTVPAEPAKDIWTWQAIYDYSKPTKQLDVADIDRDGDKDIFFVGNADHGDLEWIRNDGAGKWTPFAWFSGAGNKSHRCLLADINRDGRIDGVVGHYREDPGYLAWYEQPESATERWKEHVVATKDEVISPLSLSAADMDRDGDLDLVVGQHILRATETAKLFIFENLDGDGERWARHLVHQGDEHHQGVHVVDIDRDGDLDIASIGWTHHRVLLYENLAVR